MLVCMTELLISIYLSAVFTFYQHVFSLGNPFHDIYASYAMLKSEPEEHNEVHTKLSKGPSFLN